MNISSVSFGAVPIKQLPVKNRASTANLSRIGKIKKTIKKGLTIDKLPETGFIVGVMLPLPLTSIILPAIGIAIKYSFKSYKWIKNKNSNSFDTIA